MLRTLEDATELMDAQTKAKKRNRLLLVDESQRDQVLARRAVRQRAMQELKPLYPWTDRFLQSSFVALTSTKGSKKQIADTDAKIAALIQFETDAATEHHRIDNEPPYAGKGNDAHDLQSAIKMSHSLADFRMIENDLIKKASNKQLMNSIKNLRPTDPNKPLFISDKQASNMTLSEKAQYLVERLGEDQANILANI